MCKYKSAEEPSLCVREALVSCRHSKELQASSPNVADGGHADEADFVLCNCFLFFQKGTSCWKPSDIRLFVRVSIKLVQEQGHFAETKGRGRRQKTRTDNGHMMLLYHVFGGGTACRVSFCFFWCLVAKIFTRKMPKMKMLTLIIFLTGPLWSFKIVDGSGRASPQPISPAAKKADTQCICVPADEFASVVFWGCLRPLACGHLSTSAFFFPPFFFCCKV